jgi:hypothetical protein
MTLHEKIRCRAIPNDWDQHGAFLLRAREIWIKRRQVANNGNRTFIPGR